MNIKRTESDGSGTSFGKLGFMSLKKNAHGRRHSGDIGLFAGISQTTGGDGGEKEKKGVRGGEGGGFCCDSSDVSGILDFMMMLFMNGRQEQIQNFVAAFSNFDINMEDLFSEFAHRYHRCTTPSPTPSPPTSPHSPTPPSSKKSERKSSIVRRMVKTNGDNEEITQTASEPPKLSLSYSATFSKLSPSLVTTSSPSINTISSSSSSSSSSTSSPPFSGGSPSFLAPPPIVYGTPRAGSPSKIEKEFLQYFLKLWFFQFGSLYKRQCPLFFRQVASFLADVKDPGMNELKLLLLKNKSQSELDSALPFYQAINYANERSMAKSGFNSSLEQSLFDHYTVQELAEGITFVMFRVYGSIGPSELHDGSWQGKQRMFRAPHVHALSVLFNRISYLCACEILGAKNHENRVENLTKCSELAKTLKKMGNFEGMSAVTSIFSIASVKRLKPVLKSLDSKTQKRIKQIENTFLPLKNYKNYTELLEKATPPLLPWLAPKLRELRFMYDGNQKTASDGTLSYDFLQMVGQSVNRYLQYKRPPLNVPTPKKHLVMSLEAVPNLDPDYVEDCFYECSTKILESY